MSHLKMKATDSCEIINNLVSQDSSGGIAKLDDQGSIPGRNKRIFSTPQSQNRLWGPLRHP
jgi:hypothetical protein